MHSVSAGEGLAAELPGADYVQADVADIAEAHRLIDTVIQRHGRLDVLVNNAGVTEVIAHRDLESATPEIWRRIFDVNVIGTWQLTVAAVPHLIGCRGGARSSTCPPSPVSVRPAVPSPMPVRRRRSPT